jgi:DNA-directed RNA polymerase subunit RPC12/RpoP
MSQLRQATHHRAVSSLPAKGEDVLFNCSACGQSIAIDEAGVGLEVECPKCQATVVVPDKATPVSTTVVHDPNACVTGGVVTFVCKRCNQEISAAVARVGKLMSCPRCEGWITVPKGRTEVYVDETSERKTPQPTSQSSALAPKSSARKPNDGITRIPNRNWNSSWIPGSLRSSLERAYGVITTDEIGVERDPLMLQALTALRQIQANVDVGVGCESYALLIAQASLPVNDFVRRNGSRFPISAGCLQAALSLHQQAVSTWRSVPTGGTRFWGGGFGVGGFLLGAAISTGLNAMMESGEAKESQRFNSWLRSIWVRTGGMVNMLEDATSDLA